MTVRLDLSLANGRIANKLQKSAGDLAGNTFSSLGSWRDNDIDRYLAEIGPGLTGIKLQAARQTVAFHKQISDLAGVDFTQPVITAYDISTRELRNGAGTELVYRRPFVDMRTALSKGATMKDAIAAGERRARTLAETEVQLARRQASFKSMNEKGNSMPIAGYARTLTGAENCALCYVASTQRYHIKDLMPIHPGCDCGIMPIYSFEEVGQVINEVRLEAIHENIEARFGISDRSARAIDYRKIKISEHGEMGPILSIDKHNFDGLMKSLDLNDRQAVLDRLNFQRALGYTQDSVSPELRDAVIQYTNGSGAYSDVNGYLRSFVYRDEMSPGEIEAAKELISGLDEVIGQAPVLTKPGITYRGVTGDFATELKGLKAGQSFYDDGFVSTSWNREVAENFLDDYVDSVTMVIENPAGTRGLSTFSFRKGVTDPDFDNEMEWLLARGTKFEVIENSGDVIRVRALNALETPEIMGPTVKGFSNRFLYLDDAIRADYGPTALNQAQIILNQAGNTESAITAVMRGVSTSTGGKLEGLAFRVKGKESLARKIAKDAEEKGISMARAADEIGDAVRYTLVADEAEYASMTLKSIKELESQGYTLLKNKNYWTEGSGYKGINTNWLTPSGQKIELQFHTPLSLKTKEPSHKLYEESRKLADGPKKSELLQRSKDMWTKVAHPPNISGIGNLTRQ